jgi:hypothetical protein
MTTALAAAGGLLFGMGVLVMAFAGINAWEKSRATLRHWPEPSDD